MGQKVNPKISRSGLTNYWGALSYPANGAVAKTLQVGVIEELCDYFLRLRRLRLYFFRSTFFGGCLTLYIYYYKIHRHWWSKTKVKVPKVTMGFSFFLK